MSSTQIGLLIEKCNCEARRLHKRALIHKWIGNIANIIVIGGSAASGTIATQHGMELATTILSFTVAIVKSLMIFYMPERRALLLERISLEVARLARKLRRLDTSSPDVELVRKALEKAYDRLDEFKIRQFGGESSKVIDDDTDAAFEVTVDD